MVWIRLILLMIGTSWGLLWTRQWTLVFHKMLGSSRVSAQLTASQEGPSSLSEWVSEWVTHCNTYSELSEFTRPDHVPCTTADSTPNSKVSVPVLSSLDFLITSPIFLGGRETCFWTFLQVFCPRYLKSCYYNPYDHPVGVRKAQSV
jgi:hypothetical protein